MAEITGTGLGDLDMVQRALENEGHAVEDLQTIHGPYLGNLLRKKGASCDEVAELLADLWADGLVGTATNPPLFERYTGRSPLRSWLTAVLTNRWLSQKRRQKLATGSGFAPSRNSEMTMECQAGAALDTALMATIEQAVRGAFSECDDEEFVLLQLVHLHHITRRELCGLLNCHESGLSRRLKRTEQKIAQHILETIKAIDPLLELTWSDFLLVCESTNVLHE